MAEMKDDKVSTLLGLDLKNEPRQFVLIVAGLDKTAAGAVDKTVVRGVSL